MSAPDAPTFPIRPNNRPALPRIGYRIGAYPDIADAMLRRINAATELSLWTHRAPDDPGIAIIESAAVVADILTFYQEHYANEAYLRTAKWRESIQELVRLTGYRLAPGLGGRANFALEVRGTRPVVVPAGFPLKADLANAPDTIDFQTVAEHTAIPGLSKFRLYRQRLIQSGLPANTTRLEIYALGGSSNPAVLSAFDLKKGDKLILVPPAPNWISSGPANSNQNAAQVVKVSKVTPRLGLLVVEIEGRIDEAWAGAVTAYRINRSFRHFGHNTPVKVVYTTGSGSSLTTNQVDAHLLRHIKQTCYGAPDFLYTHLPRNYIPLDQEVSDLSAGGRIAIEALLNPTGSGTLRKVTLVRTIRALRTLTMNWGNLSGPSTWIDLGATAQLVPNASLGSATADIREFRIHEITSPAISLRNLSAHLNGAITLPNELYFYGSRIEARPLRNRRISFKADDGRFAEALVAAIDTGGTTFTRLRQVTLSNVPAGFSRSDFDEEAPTVSVYGNVVEATQGKAEKTVVLGNGDARQAFQTFKIPKAPLTYLHDFAATPPQAPELLVRVNGREWKQVDAFFAHGPLEEIYLVREDADGNSYVQFGDGENGARLPSGVQNVTAAYRSGIGALGLVKEGAKPSAGAKLDGLEKVQLPGEVTGGAQPEAADKAREAAPGKLQTLGRMVSLKDYESEALGTGGVVAAAAAWDIADGSPAISLRILLEQAQQSDTQFNAVAEILRASDRARGPDRYPIEVTQCELRYLYLKVSYAFDAILNPVEVDAALRAALGLAGDEANARTGLFGLRRRRLGESEYALRIEGVLQDVPGIIWCRATHFNLLPPGNDPEALTVPSVPVHAAQIICAPNELLQLHPRHLTLTPTGHT